MRGLVGFVVLTATLVALLAAFAVPAVVAPVVAAAVRAASPFGDQPLEVEVDVDPLALLWGQVSEIRISGANLERDGASVGALDLTVRGAGLGDREFERVEGSLATIAVAGQDGRPIRVRSVLLGGPSRAVVAKAGVDPADAVALIGAALADAGFRVDSIQLVDGGAAIGALGREAIVIPTVADGGIYVPAVLGSSPIPIIVPEPGDAWRISTVTVSPRGLDIEASVDAQRLLGRE